MKVERIRVLEVIATLDVGGAEGQLVELATRLDKDKYEVAVCCITRGGPAEEKLREQGVRVIKVGKRFKFDLGVIGKLVKVMREERWSEGENWVVQIVCICFFFNDTATTEIYTLSLHDALPISLMAGAFWRTWSLIPPLMI